MSEMEPGRGNLKRCCPGFHRVSSRLQKVFLIANTKNKPRRSVGLAYGISATDRLGFDICRLWTFGAVFYFICHFLAFGE